MLERIKRSKTSPASGNKNFPYRLPFLVFFLLHGITAFTVLSVLVDSVSNKTLDPILGWSFESESELEPNLLELQKEINTTKKPKIKSKELKTEEFDSETFSETVNPVSTNQPEAIANTELLPDPDLTYNLETTGAAWEAEMELSIKENKIHNSKNDDFSKHKKTTHFDRTEEEHFPDFQSGSKENPKKNTIDEISNSDFLIKDQKIKTFLVSTDFPNQEFDHIQKIETSKPEPPDEVQKIKTSKPDRRDKLTQLYILEVERYLSRNSQKKNGAPLSKEYSEVVIDALEQVHWKDDLKFDSLEQVHRKDDLKFDSLEQVHRKDDLKFDSLEQVHRKDDLKFDSLEQVQSKTIPTIRQDVAVLETGFEEETANPQKAIESVSDLRFKEKVNNRFSETVTNQKGVLNLEFNSDSSKNTEHRFGKVEDMLDSASWEWKADTFEIRILENVNIEKWAWEYIREKSEEIKTGRLQNNLPSSLSENVERTPLYPPRRDQSNLKNQKVTSINSGDTRKHSDFLILLSHLLEVPNLNRKLMRYYSIRMNGPPPTVHKQV
ncbi:hypothetical protein [Leptospira mayottensis]|uniref:Uncharacterized protein n=1 Tax=Leptospira mayottensis TaxID=1137606 RepID=A0ABM6Y886_9LEPT|nr:hypothetical protein [Leptospira mayottensis]AXR62005.1 hypothetical protein DQM68_16320 [Leptospira mayottensis]AXR62196.1 hypothetical protein DQM68_17550 [Leptospira mayottensis]AXR62201.1 hypothetical protein DQM68_17585 [Leptospira mayottensis]AXR63073.1 hypothetical protein DQM28_01190 [Leptospira mayottensis]AZQ01543.1 hypothetical protein LEP1GSC190_05400 [Leptospira mayottensis 200901116]